MSPRFFSFFEKYTFVLIGGSLLGLLGSTDAAYAQDLQIKASLSEKGVWDSNPLMRTTYVDEMYGSTTTPRLAFSQKGETRNFMAETWLDYNVFNLDQFNSTDVFGRLMFTKSTQRTEYGLNARGAYDTTRTSELTTFGLETDTVRHQQYALSPFLKYNLSPVSQFSLTASYDKNIYDDKASYKDYHNYSVSPSYIRHFTPQYAGVLGGTARRYEADEGVDRVVDSLGPFVGLIATVNEGLSAQAQIGQEASRDKRAGIVLQDWEWNSVYSVAVHLKREEDALDLSARRAQQSYGNGSDYLLTTLSAEGKKQLSPLFSLQASLSYQFSGNEETTDKRLDDLYTGLASLTYHWTETLGISTSCRYKRETFTTNTGIARQTLFRLGISYTPAL